MTRHADYTFLGNTQSLCPSCLELLPAKIIARGKRVYFRKKCKKCGERDDFVCSNLDWYDRTEFMLPAKLPTQYGAEPQKGCPYDCGLCSEHEQHTCVGLVELTSSCNLNCPMCFAVSGPGGKHITKEDCFKAIDRLVEVEGRAEVLQLSGGEPTIHPQFREILDYAVAQPIDYVMINSNGVRFAQDGKLVEHVSQYQDQVEVFFQLDGLRRETTIALRGEDLLDIKLRAIDRLGEAGVHITLAVTLQGGLNLDEVGPLIQFAAERPWITAINFQPATYSGRFELPEVLENRITFPDVIRASAEQTGRMFEESDFLPLPCAHPNCHSVSYAYRSSQGLVPLARFINARENFDLLANGITLTRERATTLIGQLLGRQGCCGGECGPTSADQQPTRNESTCETASTSGIADNPLQQLNGNTQPTSARDSIAQEFFARALGQQLGARDLLRITITSFLDAYTFDVRRLMKCCTHHVLPSGHVIPFCAYNVLYRNGHVPLPEIVQAVNEATAVEKLAAD